MSWALGQDGSYDQGAKVRLQDTVCETCIESLTLMMLLGSGA